jgi:biopolymer transport protein ExbD
MKIRRKHREGAEVETSAMNDIMFFLLLFFLIVSTLANPNVIQILLPKASKTESVVETKVVNVSVDEQSDIWIDANRLVPTGAETKYEMLTSELQKLKNVYEPVVEGADESAQSESKLVVVLRLYYGLKVQEMVDVMQIGADMGIKMVLATEKGKK